MRYSGSIAKWPILVAALLMTLATLPEKSRIAAYGTIAAGFWIAFAVLHAGDRVAKRVEDAVSSRADDITPKQ